MPMPATGWNSFVPIGRGTGATSLADKCRTGNWSQTDRKRETMSTQGIILYTEKGPHAYLQRGECQS